MFVTPAAPKMDLLCFVIIAQKFPAIVTRMFVTPAACQVDLEEKGDKYDEIAAILRRVAGARSEKEVSYVIADFEDISGITSRFQVNLPSSERFIWLVVDFTG